MRRRMCTVVGAIVSVGLLAPLTVGASSLLTEDGKLHGDHGGGGPGAPGDHVGRAVAIESDTAVVGAEGNDSVVSGGGLVYVFARGEAGWVEQQRLAPSSPVASQLFGAALALSGDTIVVGAWGDRQLAQGAGAAYVFVRSGGVWVEQQKLVAADGQAYDGFGRHVAVSGDVAVIGAAGDDDLGDGAGAAYVFSRSGGVWSQQQKLLASDGTAGDAFGRGVAVAGSTAVVGARGDDDGGASSGSAYVFVASAGQWTEEQKLVASDMSSSDSFGSAVAVTGDLVVVGAYLANGAASSAGAAYVFTRTGSVWSEQQKLSAADGQSSDGFGSAVAVAGDNVVVGAPDDDDLGSSSGSAYLFTRGPENWNETAKLVAGDGMASDHFGWGVALDDATAIVGAPDDGQGGQWAGAAYTFVGGLAEQKLTGTANAAGDYFGWAAAADGGILLVGAPGDDPGGSVTFLDLEAGAWVARQKLVPPVASDGSWFGGWVDLAGDVALVGAMDDSEAALHAGAAYVLTRSDGVWSHGAKLIASDAQAEQYFGVTVATSGDTILVNSYSEALPGAVYVFVQDGDTWVEQQKITAPLPSPGDYFGYPAVVEGDTALLGAGGDDEAGVDAGAVYFYRRSGGMWVQEQKLIASAATAGDSFGWPALAGDRALIGAPSADGGAGAVYAFARLGGVWVEQQRLSASDAVLDAGFGLVTMAGDHAVVVALHASCLAKSSGAAYLLELEQGLWVERRQLCASDGSSEQWFGVLEPAVATGAAVVVGAPADADDAPAAGALYLFGLPFFADGFESGDLTAWSITTR